MNSGASRWLAGTAAVVAVLAVAGVIAALLAGGTEAFPEDSPEGTVQRYLQAVEKSDYRAAHAHLGGQLRQDCPLQEFRQQMRWRGEQSDRVLLDKTEEVDGRVFVQVRILNVSMDGPFAPSETSRLHEYALEREDGAWRFVEPPWPLGYCKQAPLPVPTVLPADETTQQG